MTNPRTYSLKNVRADGWFDKIGENIGSFDALCEIVGEKFVAFSLITGTQIRELAVDRRNPDNTLVVFVTGDSAGDDFDVEPQRLTLGDFRRRLVATLLTGDEPALMPHAEAGTDPDALRLHIGVKNVLLAPLYGYSLQELTLGEKGTSVIRVDIDGEITEIELEDFRNRLRNHIRDELDRLGPPQRGVIELARVGEAEAAVAKGDFLKVRQLLGAWPAPLSIFLRTPDGQALSSEARGMLAKAMSLLALACVKTGDAEQAEEIFRLGVQYAQDGPAAAAVFQQIGEVWLEQNRAGESIAALRRAINLGAPAQAWAVLGRAFIARQRFVAAAACIEEAIAGGMSEDSVADVTRAVNDGLGSTLHVWQDAVSDG